MLKKIKAEIEKEFRHYNRKRESGTLSYSQCGEDLIVQYIFSLRGVLKPTYLDIGAHHPFALSNTAIFYMKGCRGVNVEANPDLFRFFKRHRLRDINLNLGIGPEQATRIFILWKIPR